MISKPMIDELLKELQGGHTFVIMMHRFQSWYYQKLKVDPSVTGVIWTPHLTMAHFFPDEKSVEEFKMNYISPRKVEILRLDKG